MRRARRARGKAQAQQVTLAADRLLRTFTGESAEPGADSESQIVTVDLHFPNIGQRLRLELPRDGRLSRRDARRTKHFFRCRRTGRRRWIAPGVLAVIADIAGRYPGHTIEVISGYRAPPYGVRHSKHFLGRAIDLRVVGVSTKEVRDYVWQRHTNLGLGHYHRQDFLHVDYRPDENDAAWSSLRIGAPYRNNPKWSRVARQVLVQTETRLAEFDSAFVTPSRSEWEHHSQAKAQPAAFRE